MSKGAVRQPTNLKDWDTMDEYFWDPPMPYAMLLQDAAGQKESKSAIWGSSSFIDKHILRGSLLAKLSHDEVRELKHQHNEMPHFNFKFLEDPTIKLFCSKHVVHMLDYDQKELLHGITSLYDRHDALNKLEWAEKLRKSCEVYVAIAGLPKAAKGVIRFIGKLPTEPGTKFGIELLEFKYHGTSNGTFQNQPYFVCDKDCAVFVALDKLLSSCVDVVTKPAGGGVTAGRGTGTVNHPKQVQPQKSIEAQQQYAAGNRVLAFDDKGGTVKGTIKWIGGSTGKKRVAGIETDVPINHKSFCDHVSGMYSYFTPSQKRGKNYQLFLPFNCILKEEASHNVGGSSVSQEKEDLSITTELTNQFAKQENESPNAFKEQQAKRIEENRKAAEKKFAIKEMNLHPKDVDETMSAEAQAKIFEDIKKQHSHGGGVHPPQDGRHTNGNCHQSNHPPAVQHNLQSRRQQLPPADDYSSPHAPSNQDRNVQSQDPPAILRYGEMRPQNQQMKYANTNDRYPDTQQQSQYNLNYSGMPNPHVPAAANLPQQHHNVPKLVYEQPFSEMVPASSHPYASGGTQPYTSGGTQPYVSGGTHYPQAGQNYTHPQNTGGQYYGNQYGQQVPVPYNNPDGNAFMQVGGGAGLPPHSASYQQPNPGQPQWSENYQNHPAIRENIPLTNINPYNLEMGSMIQYSHNPTYTGVIRWIGGHMAGVEMDYPFEDGNDGTYDGIRRFDTDPRRGWFVPLNRLIPNQQYMQRTEVKPNPFKIASGGYVPSSTTAHFVQAPQQLDIKLHTGVKGIQGQQNSCYLDATLYGMFAFSDAFDALFLERKGVDDFERKVKNTLEQKIVNPLRKVHAVIQDAVLALREELATLQKMKGITSDEKDPEEFLNLLFKHVLHVDPFLVINRPSGDDKEFFIQLFVGPDENIPMPDTYWLLHKMFKDEKITFKEYPQKLLLQIPRHGKQFKAFERVKPTLKLDVSVLCNGYAGPCFICDNPGKKLCIECGQLDFLKDDTPLYFCEGCSTLWHSHTDRQFHKPIARSGTADTHDLELLSVLCIETSHYVCFTRITGSGKDEWVFFDSMATRTDDEYNLPRVVDCTNDINEWVYGDKDISKTPLKQLPELVRRYVGDPYLCIYTEFGGNLYG